MSEDPNSIVGGSTLDQSEIDRLLAQEVAVAPPRQFLIRPDGARGAPAALKVEAYDFRNPVFLSEIELRRLRLLHEDFIRYLSARLSLYLRMELGLKMARLTTSTYAKFTDSLPNPTHLCLFKVEPLVGVGILDVNPRLALTIADRLLGGRGHSVKAERYLTEIEIALIEDVINIVLEEWCAQWKTEQELHPVLIGHENNGRFLQTSPKDARVLLNGTPKFIGTVGLDADRVAVQLTRKLPPVEQTPKSDGRKNS
jgi:flagellar motor switch protein FliM